jgi:hypothetical protein
VGCESDDYLLVQINSTHFECCLKKSSFSEEEGDGGDCPEGTFMTEDGLY